MTNEAADKLIALVDHLVNKYRTEYPGISDDDLIATVRRALIELAK